MKGGVDELIRRFIIGRQRGSFPFNSPLVVFAFNLNYFDNSLREYDHVSHILEDWRVGKGKLVFFFAVPQISNLTEDLGSARWTPLHFLQLELIDQGNINDWFS